MTARTLYCHHVVHSAGSDGNTEWRFLTSCPQVLRVLKECLWEAFDPSKRAGRISIISFTFRAQHDAPAYTKLEWLFIGFFCSHSTHNVTLRRILRLPTSVGLAQARPNYISVYSYSFITVMLEIITNNNVVTYCIAIIGTLKINRLYHEVVEEDLGSPVYVKYSSILLWKHVCLPVAIKYVAPHKV